MGVQIGWSKFHRSILEVMAINSRPLLPVVQAQRWERTTGSTMPSDQTRKSRGPYCGYMLTMVQWL